MLKNLCGKATSCCLSRRKRLSNGVILAIPIVSDRLRNILPQTWSLLAILVPPSFLMAAISGYNFTAITLMKHYTKAVRQRKAVFTKKSTLLLVVKATEEEDNTNQQLHRWLQPLAQKSAPCTQVIVIVIINQAVSQTKSNQRRRLIRSCCAACNLCRLSCA